jgi:hypothetical protein
VEVGAVAGGDVLRVDGGVDEADRRLAAFSQLLIDQRNEACPHRRGKTRATVFVGQARCLIGTGVEGEIGIGRNVWAVAKSCRTLIA